MELSTTELFNLGVAYGLFSDGDIDGGVHMVLPGVVPGEDLVDNEVFRSLCDEFLTINADDPDWSEVGQLYMERIVKWTKRHGIEIGR